MSIQSHILYKYRSLENFRFFVDIILKNRLYAAPYRDLNDPMEGYYYYPEENFTHPHTSQILEKIHHARKEIRIVSLSRDPKIPLMWSHYADGHRGVAIGVEINRDTYDVRPIEYTGPAYFRGGEYHSDTAKEILSHKFEFWKYEQEERVFVDSGQFIKVKVVEVMAGQKMSNQDYGFIKSLIEKLNPTIRVKKLTRSESGFVPPIR
ncbi:MAG: DUF2971 domain-containing protein [Bacteroidota bacterium]